MACGPQHRARPAHARSRVGPGGVCWYDARAPRADCGGDFPSDPALGPDGCFRKYGVLFDPYDPGLSTASMNGVFPVSSSAAAAALPGAAHLGLGTAQAAGRRTSPSAAAQGGRAARIGAAGRLLPASGEGLASAFAFDPGRRGANNFKQF